MTAVRRVHLYCDYREPPSEGSQWGHACLTEFHPEPGSGTPSMTVLRQQAKKAGWTFVRWPGRATRVLDNDYCPHHKPQEETR